jgi:hypothetical protein
MAYVSYVWSVTVILILCQLDDLRGQDTLSRSSCQFQDGPVIYNVELNKGLVEQPCPTETLSNQFKETEQRTLELSYQVSQLQSTLIRAMEANMNLTLKVEELKTDLIVTKEALRMHRAGL